MSIFVGEEVAYAASGKIDIINRRREMKRREEKKCNCFHELFLRDAEIVIIAKIRKFGF